MRKILLAIVCILTGYLLGYYAPIIPPPYSNAYEICTAFPRHFPQGYCEAHKETLESHKY